MDCLEALRFHEERLLKFCAFQVLCTGSMLDMVVSINTGGRGYANIDPQTLESS